MTALSNSRMLTHYKAWADDKMFSMLSALPEEELLRPRATRFGNMLHTMNHIHVIDDVFRAHLLGQQHGYQDRNTASTPPLHELWDAVKNMDQWYRDFTQELSEADLERVIHFNFIGGGQGVMSCQEMLLHVVNHSTYHRGFVGDMMYQAGVMPQSSDLTVFVRDVLRV
ncbi:DinB family protein [Undibacterium sp. Ji50W]|uniref:DinB family protein n=1 Tax=Undibacterium sp. Ji50W TaxID=3413041 RepID=UPI003BEF5AC0